MNNFTFTQISGKRCRCNQTGEVTKRPKEYAFSHNRAKRKFPKPGEVKPSPQKHEVPPKNENAGVSRVRGFWNQNF